jgi:hemolysin activation/secretion protein
MNRWAHRALVYGSLLAWLVSHPGWTQPVPGQRPGDSRPELPTFEPPAAKPGTVLPLVTPPLEPGIAGTGETLFVREIRISGNTVLDSAQLDALTVSYTNREVSFAELIALRDRITLEYVRRGFTTSGAVLPDQEVESGIVLIEVREGYLTSVEIEADGRYRASYLEQLIRNAAPGPVNVYVLEEYLRLIQADERIASLHATLTPGQVPGESVLHIELSERRALQFDTDLSNHQSPSIGADNVSLELSHVNLRGVGDEIRAEYRVSEGLDAVEGSYRWPVGARGTELELYGYNTRSSVVESPFDALDIESRSRTYALRLHQSLQRSLGRSQELFVSAEHRSSESFLLGVPFSFDAAADDGEIALAVLRVGHEWTRSSPVQVLAARTTLSCGLDAFDATAHSAPRPDGQFVAWLGQLQWARRLGERGFELGARVDAQLANDALPGLEQLAVGGSTSVRGYREYLLVRDNGLVGSLEARMPVLHSNSGTPRLELAYFVDAGRSWNDGESGFAETLWSAGIGLRWRFARWGGMELQWAEAFSDVPPAIDHDLQDDGIHYRIWSHL